jgi:hypothetical protein
MLKNISFVFILIILCINSICFKPEEFKCDHSKIDKLKVGDEVVLCIHTIDPIPNSSPNQKFAISIKVDEYSILSVDGIHALSGNKDMELLAQINEVTSVFTTVSI